MLVDNLRSLKVLNRDYRSESDCREYLEDLRWPDGFVCPVCGGKNAASMRRGLWYCRSCRRQTSVLAGTVFQDTHLPLNCWFQAMWHMIGHKYRLSALELKQELDLNYRTAWTMLHKLRRVMAQAEQERLKGRVYVGTTSWGSKREHITKRQTEKAVPIAMAVEVENQNIKRIRLARLSRLDGDTLDRFVADTVEPGSSVHRVGLRVLFDQEGYSHDRQGHEHDEDYDGPRSYIDDVVWRLEHWLTDKHRGPIALKYLDDYLAEFTFRRNNLGRRLVTTRFNRLTTQAVRIPPQSYAVMTHPQRAVEL